MLPKIIHYCWFGRNPLPELALKCIESWKKFLPDYEIKEWNEDNYDVHKIPYISEAYDAKKYAFVSDYAIVAGVPTKIIGFRNKNLNYKCEPDSWFL